MRVLIVAAEAAPYIKVGGLGDVAGSLPPALASLGHEVRLALPRVQGVMPRRGARIAWTDSLPHGDGRVDVSVITGRLPGVGAKVDVRLIDCPVVLGGSALYSGPTEAERFVLFVRAALTDCEHSGFVPDVIQAHDWHAALVPVEIARRRVAGEPLGMAKTLLTIHNMAYQGVQDAAFAQRFELDPPGAPGDIAPNRINLLGRGLASADRVTAVSPTFAQEITTPSGGFGLHRVLAERGDDVAGIVNGIDLRSFDPARDAALAQRYSAKSAGRRAANRSALVEEMGIDAPRSAPIVGIVSRLVEQKGLDVLLAAGDALVARGARLVVLGSGESGIEDGFRILAARHPRAVAFSLGYNDPLARRIYAGCDVFTMPSRFEPCGLGQLIAMRYGAVPFVRRTGGLADTVEPVFGDSGTGFLFDAPTVASFLAELDVVIAAFRDRMAWRALQLRCMERDSSWHASALAYDGVMRAAVGDPLSPARDTRPQAAAASTPPMQRVRDAAR